MVQVRRLLLPVLLLLGAGGSPPATGAEPYVVVVNAANPVTALPAEEVSRFFLHKSDRWPNGTKVTAVDLVEDSPARDAFSRVIHQRSTSAVKAYWQRLIFSGRDVPPPEKSNAEALSFVRSNLGAIAYVASGTPLGDGVKALRVTP
jgi:ABC-type phosphate transport system substrate-binding protein